MGKFHEQTGHHSVHLSSNDTSRKDPEGRRPIVDSHLHFGQTSLPGMMEEDSEEEDG